MEKPAASTMSGQTSAAALISSAASVDVTRKSPRSLSRPRSPIVAIPPGDLTGANLSEALLFQTIFAGNMNLSSAKGWLLVLNARLEINEGSAQCSDCE